MDKVRFLMSDTGAQITAACREALEQKGVEVTVVEKDGNKVLQKMLSVRPQVVLLDAFMPGLDALAVKQRYNAAGERHTSFFVTGAFQSEEMVQELLDEGFAYYFVKPFDENVLASRVLKVALGQEKRVLHTSVDSDELTVTDPLDCVAAGLARLTSIETPVCFKDWDGRLNVWYQTSLNDKADASDADAYNACDSNPANPNNPENERMCDFTGWKLWREGVPALSSATLSVEDLGLAEGEYVTAVRFEHGRVEPGFATRGAGEVWERDDLKATNDSIGASESYVHASTFEEDAKAMMYAPAVLHMSVTSDAYALESAELWNGAEMRVWRNKGAVPELLYDDDSDRVVQQTYPELTKTTVTEQAPKARFFDKTGDWLLEHWPALVAGAAAVILGCALIALGGRKAKGSGSESPAPEDHGSVV